MKAIIVLFLACIARASFADAPDLPMPPPYGAYWWDRVHQTKEEYKAATDAIAQHYGYRSGEDAGKDCVRKLGGGAIMACSIDPVAHRRSESLEIAKYGFKSWNDAVFACIKNKPPGFGATSTVNKNAKVAHCQADPFLRLRQGIK